MGCEKWGPFDRTSSPSIEWSVWRGTWERKHPKIKNTNGIGFVSWNLNLLCWSRDPLTQTSLDFQMATKRERERERGEQKSPCPVVWLASVRLTSLDVRCSVHEPITRLSLSSFHRHVKHTTHVPRCAAANSTSACTMDRFFHSLRNPLETSTIIPSFSIPMTDTRRHEQVYVSMQVNLWYLYVTWRKKFFIYIRDS